MNREKTSGPEVKGCLVRGYRSLIDAAERAARERGATIRLGVSVRAIEREGEAMALRYADGSSERFDLVVATSPLPQFQTMTRSLGLDPAIANLELDYQGVVNSVFLLERPLTTNYWMPIVDSGTTCQGVIEMSNLVPLERSRGLHVTYVVNYCHRSGPLFARGEDEVLEAHRADLERLFPGSTRNRAGAYAFRAPHVEPVWHLDYRRHMPPTTVIPGRLYLACTAQVYPDVNSWNSCCGVVERLVAGLTADLGARVRSA
jgi:protoporphyrinogen oxidase